MASIGKRLSKAREEKGQSIEDVAHVTHIHSTIIREIENDDFSNFASTGYAKSFLKQYGNHLDVDVSDAIAGLERGTAEAVGRPEVDTMVAGVKEKIERSSLFRPVKAKRMRRPRVEKPGGAPVFLSFILVVLILSIGVFYFLGYQASSPEEFKDKLEESISKTGLISDKASSSELAATNAGTGAIERNPLKVDKPETESPAPAGTTPPPSRSDELLSVDFNDGPITAGKTNPRVPLPPKPAGTDQPAVLRPAGTDPVNKRPEAPILRAIPVPQPPTVPAN